MEDTVDNETRAARIAPLVDRYIAETQGWDQDLPTITEDMLADFLHFANASGLLVPTLVKAALDHYYCENVDPTGEWYVEPDSLEDRLLMRMYQSIVNFLSSVEYNRRQIRKRD